VRRVALAVPLVILAAVSRNQHECLFRFSAAVVSPTWLVTRSDGFGARTCSQSLFSSEIGRPRKYNVPDQLPVAAEAMLAGGKWRRVNWRRGTKGRLTCLFAARRVRVANGHKHRMLDNRMQCMPGDEVWLVGERRSTGEQKYYVSNLPTDTSLKMLAATIKARWVCEQAHQQLKEELGLDHFEGRSWTGLHRHALMTMIAYAFLQSRRLRAAGRKKKSRGAAATTEHAGHQASYPRSVRTASAQAMPSL
jgi:SRSO17 transposase